MIYSNYSQAKKNVQDDFCVLYICSAARSGSTLTDMFLGGHSKVASLGEVDLLGKAISLDATCSCGDKLRACIQWRKIFDAILAVQGVDLIKNPYKFKLWDIIAFNEIDYQQQKPAYRLAINLRKAWMGIRDHLPHGLRKDFPIPPILLKALHNKMNLYREISRCWNKSVIVDSSKVFREAIELHQRWPDRVKVILLVRDGRGVYLSRRSSGRSQSESVRGWLSYYRRALPLLESHITPSSLLKIRYEDIASDPRKAGQLLCDFAGISFESNMLDLAQSTRHLVNGNYTKFSPGRGIQLDERWLTELNGEELDFFERIGGNMNHRLGYR
ncbi:sulfotransferase family protein [Nitrosomonas sp. Nm84]|uniref:sulfotransferase n=1 Tax=Nitrosomonas sp. Nm84 TaxID=200124 RepID=UPI000D753B48|nr:sulfotransferase [Nitrosomonas sp. Nm84]PXW81383.1 sulfotransferase family protein [Nitrosomonas sp. Nm84]